MNLNRITQNWLLNFPGDFSGNPMQRQTPKVLFSTVQPAEFPSPVMILFNEKLSEEIGLGRLGDDEKFLAAQNLPKNIKTYATAYAGHQFGNWAGQLGDGRAIFAGEIKNSFGKSTEIQWKGAGATPYSRFADGRAVLRSSLREYLCSEAMHFLGVPTTRALSLCLSGENVVRDMLYNGNPAAEKGAVVIRTAESFLRFGHFELLSAQKEIGTLKKLADFTAESYFPEISTEGKEKYQNLLTEICSRTAYLMVEWYRTGFVHGVMNTDNMSVLGLTIDYGPFSFLDEFDLNFTPNTTDLPGRRYAFGKQAQIAQWNLWQLANAFFPLVEDAGFLEDTLNNFSDIFWQRHDEMLCRKFGFEHYLPEDTEFFTKWQTVMQDLKIDYTLFFNDLERYVGDFSENAFKDCFYKNLNEEEQFTFTDFMVKYLDRLKKNNFPAEESLALMKKNNPKFILRNYLLYECIEQVDAGNTELLDKLVVALQNPYEEIFPEFSQKRPAKYNGIPGCGTLSCSS